MTSKCVEGLVTSVSRISTLILTDCSEVTCSFMSTIIQLVIFLIRHGMSEHVLACIFEGPLYNWLNRRSAYLFVGLALVNTKQTCFPSPSPAGRRRRVGECGRTLSPAPTPGAVPVLRARGDRCGHVGSYPGLFPPGYPSSEGTEGGTVLPCTDSWSVLSSQYDTLYLHG